MIHVSPTALEQLKMIQARDKKEDHVLRVSVVGGGCSGMSYKLDFDKETKEKDKVFEVEGIKIVVDSKSYLYVKDMTLDFSGGLNGTGFGFINPNAKRTCGCGSSFST